MGIELHVWAWMVAACLVVWYLLAEAIQTTLEILL